VHKKLRDTDAPHVANHRSHKAAQNGKPHNGKRPSHAKSPHAKSPPSLSVRDFLEDLDLGIAHAFPDGTVLYANRSFLELLGVPFLDDIAGANLKSFVSAASWQPLEVALARAPQEQTEGELRVETPSGTPRTVRLCFSPVRATTIKIIATEVTELVEKTKALQSSESALHTLSARLLQLQDEERRRIARDLHDVTGQELAVAAMSLDHLTRTLDRPGLDKPKAVTAITESAGLIHKVEQEIRTLSYVLHPPLLDEMGLGSAVNWYVDGLVKRSGMQIETHIPAQVKRLSVEKEIALFRVIQESLTNVLRHSGTNRARVRISVDSDSIQVAVEDEGKGLDTRKLSSATAKLGVGIQGMRGRLHQLGGKLEVSSSARGTHVLATVPLRDLGDSAARPTEFEVSTKSNGEPADTIHESQGRKRILIVDDHEVARQGIRALLREQSDLEICGEAEDGLEAVTKTKDLAPDLVILDLSMPRAGGLSAAHQIRHNGLSTKILIFTTHSYPGLDRMLRSAGCDGYVHKANASNDLIRGVRAVLHGEKFYDAASVRQQHA
jgi:two-component system, NarL family, sensor kinase